MNLRRAVRTYIVPACVTAALGLSALIAAPPAMADPINDARTQLSQLEAQRSAIEDKYNDSKQRLAAAQTRENDLASDIAAQQKQLDALRPTIVWIVTMQRQSSGASMTVDFLMNDTADGFLTQLGTMNSVTNLINGQISQFVSEQDRLADLKSSLQSTVTSIQAEVATQKQLLADAKAKEDAQQKVLNRLTAQQRAAVTAATGGASTSKSKADNTDYTAPAPGSTKASAKALKALAYALKQKGKPYVYGGSGPNSFDCSGLTMMAYKQVGISLPHSAHLQARMGTPVKRADLLPGDLLFFYTPISHVGMYIGNGMMIHASNPRTGIKVSPIEASFNTARRIA